LEFCIEYLVDHPPFVPTLAQWHHAQWSYLAVGVTLEQWAAALREHGKHQVPTTVIAVANQALLGSASLIAHDMDTRMDLLPWMASVYVAPAYRRRGIGSALVKRIVEEARDLGYERLYLYTPDKEHFYARLGWVALERTMYRGYPQVVMALDLADQQDSSDS